MRFMYLDMNVLSIVTCACVSIDIWGSVPPLQLHAFKGPGRLENPHKFACVGHISLWYLNHQIGGNTESAIVSIVLVPPSFPQGSEWWVVCGIALATETGRSTARYLSCVALGLGSVADAAPGEISLVEPCGGGGGRGGRGHVRLFGLSLFRGEAVPGDAAQCCGHMRSIGCVLCDGFMVATFARRSASDCRNLEFAASAMFLVHPQTSRVQV